MKSGIHRPKALETCTPDSTKVKVVQMPNLRFRVQGLQGKRLYPPQSYVEAEKDLCSPSMEEAKQTSQALSMETTNILRPLANSKP